MEVTLSGVIKAARQRRAAVTAEVGGYIVLLVLQRLVSAPRWVSTDGIGLTAAGEIELSPGADAEPRQIEGALRDLLALLLALPQSAPPALRATSERPAVGDLAALEAELTAALIPLNHAAAKRALARVFRETHKAQRGAAGDHRPSESSSPAPSSVSTSSAEPRESSLSERGAPLPELEIDVEVDVEAVLAEAEPPAVPLGVVAPESVPEATAAVSAVIAPLAEPAALQGADSTPPRVALALTPAAAALRAHPAEWAPLPSHSAVNVAADRDPACPVPAPLAARIARDSEPVPQRSDLEELLKGYLSYTRCEADMTAGLRKLIGLETRRTPESASDRTRVGQ